jgi:hypothetical protein
MAAPQKKVNSILASKKEFKRPTAIIPVSAGKKELLGDGAVDNKVFIKKLTSIDSNL